MDACRCRELAPRCPFDIDCCQIDLDRGPAPKWCAWNHDLALLTTQPQPPAHRPTVASPSQRVARPSQRVAHPSQRVARPYQLDPQHHMEGRLIFLIFFYTFLFIMDIENHVTPLVVPSYTQHAVRCPQPFLFYFIFYLLIQIYPSLPLPMPDLSGLYPKGAFGEFQPFSSSSSFVLFS
ncbi:hypothetical protein BC939DRAFT_436344 [Gamsiella multidivaricata]|uniref:uncharacterized protein n=1 Tax=Gamsiella multidivaricata TaxID=101098 RepID=UPI0022200FB9|nr:uncharacterized protein BC939DRAFT_436344 [Gamsiella multidivaricata]KAI7831735.1 hypothetical protein BC939DRAFT_436344 [Gamsiella multidivaricata]